MIHRLDTCLTSLTMGETRPLKLGPCPSEWLAGSHRRASNSPTIDCFRAGLQSCHTFARDAVVHCDVIRPTYLLILPGQRTTGVIPPIGLSPRNHSTTDQGRRDRIARLGMFEGKADLSRSANWRSSKSGRCSKTRRFRGRPKDSRAITIPVGLAPILWSAGRDSSRSWPLRDTAGCRRLMPSLNLAAKKRKRRSPLRPNGAGSP